MTHPCTSAAITRNPPARKAGAGSLFGWVPAWLSRRRSGRAGKPGLAWVGACLAGVWGIFPAPPPCQACTAFFLTGSPDSVVAKTLDWFEGRGLIFVNKRDILKHALAEISFHWKSRYMSLTLTQTGREFPWEGMNEAGLSVNVLELAESLAPPPEDPLPMLEQTQWIQYILDTSATLREAELAARKVRVGPTTTVHYFVCDSGGSCGVFEYLGGGLVIHAGRDLPFPALANDPYESSVRYFRRLIGSEGPLPILRGSSPASLDRFARAALWSESLGATPGGEIRQAFAGLGNVAEATSDLRTYWRMVFALGHQDAYVSTLDAPGIKLVHLGSFDPSCASGTLMLDINSRAGGDVTRHFQPYSPSANLALVESSRHLRPAEKTAIEIYPEAWTRCQEDSPGVPGGRSGSDRIAR